MESQGSVHIYSEPDLERFAIAKVNQTTSFLITPVKMVIFTYKTQTYLNPKGPESLVHSL